MENWNFLGDLTFGKKNLWIFETNENHIQLFKISHGKGEPINFLGEQGQPFPFPASFLSIPPLFFPNQTGGPVFPRGFNSFLNRFPAKPRFFPRFFIPRKGALRGVIGDNRRIWQRVTGTGAAGQQTVIPESKKVLVSLTAGGNLLPFLQRGGSYWLIFCWLPSWKKKDSNGYIRVKGDERWTRVWESRAKSQALYFKKSISIRIYYLGIIFKFIN